MTSLETTVVSTMIVDDSPFMRSGLKALLSTSPEIDIVAEARDGNEAIMLVRRHEPDVVLLDVRMPGRDGLSALEELCAHSRVLMLTFSDEPEFIRTAMLAGAVGYLVHGHFEPPELVSSVLSAARGNGVFSALALTALRDSLNAPAGPRDRDRFGLTARELEVMELIALGRTNTEIANEVFVAVKTVKNHVNRILAKLGVRTRSEAVSLWLRGDQ